MDYQKKWIENCKGLYMIDTKGDVWSYHNNRHGLTKEPKKLKKSKDKGGYLVVNLIINNKVKQMKVHRLVAKAFIPNPENKPHVNHLNCLRDDNRVENLEWVTQVENNQYEPTRKNISKGLQGRNINNPSYSKKIDQYTIDNVFIKEWESVREITRKLGTPSSNIIACCKSKRKSAGGFIWKYKQEEVA